MDMFLNSSNHTATSRIENVDFIQPFRYYVAMMHVARAIHLKISLALLLIFWGLGTACTQSTPSTPPQHGTNQAVDLPLTQYVNPFVGTSPGSGDPGFPNDSGDTFPGASYPMGMLQWSPDTPTNIPGGYYYPDTTIKELSLTHFSGRGCQVYQDVPFMPYVGNLTTSPDTHRSLYFSHFSHANESAQPGFYSVHLDDPNVDAELTVTSHTGMGQFTYPASTASTMLINAGGSVNGTMHSSVTIDSRLNQVQGSATSRVGCGNNPYTIYFVAQFDRAFHGLGTWHEGTVLPGSLASSGRHVGAFVTFDTTSQRVVHARVAISFVSIANARANLLSENLRSDFSSLRASASAAWNARLNSIQVQGGSDVERRVFYTALYHVFFHPNIFSDVNGEYLGFDGRVHSVAQGHAQYENITGWDQYRSLIQLRAILAPAETSDIIQSLLNDARQGDGHLPRWVQANADSHGMNGDDGDPLVANAYAFGATAFDTAAALTAMTHSQAKIREGLNDYKKLGYVASTTTGNSVAITEEYSVDDFSIAAFARSLGNASVYKTYVKRSANWQHVFHAATGLIQPRQADGSWAPGFSPTSQQGFQEGNSLQYIWMVPFDLPGLFGRMGGDAQAVQRLDAFFAELNAGANSPYAFMGNEPSFEAPWEYDFAHAPSHTQAVVRRIQHLFQDTSGGLPGNDDGGAMSSWYIFSALGLYPELPGIGGFAIGSPLFSSVRVRLAGGHFLQINAPAALDTNPYVEALRVNGQPTTNLWLAWKSVKNGASLDFQLSSTPTSWGTGVQN